MNRIRRVWHLLGDTRIAFVLLLAVSATLLTGAFYAEHHSSLIRELNRMRIQDWFPGHWTAQPERIWWVPLLFVLMTGLGINTFVCAANRSVRLLGQRRAWPAATFLHLLTPSLIHFLFLFIMLGHLTTFAAGTWQTVPLEAGGELALEGDPRSYRVLEIRDRFYPDGSALHHRIAQTRVTLAAADGTAIHLAYTRPVLADGRIFLLDKIKRRSKAAKRKILPLADEETCNKAALYVEPDKERKNGRQHLLVVSDPGLPVIVTGLASILLLMLGYFLFQTNGGGQNPHRKDAE